MKNTIALISIILAMITILMLAGYVGISKSLCYRLDQYSAAQQAAMGLDRETCAQRWLGRF